VFTACTGWPGKQRRLLATTLRIGRKEEAERRGKGERKEQGQKVHFRSVLSHEKLEINILLTTVSRANSTIMTVSISKLLHFVCPLAKIDHFECPVANFAYK
jgi:hypothetical protein